MSFYSFPFDLTPEGEPQQVQEGRFRKLLRAAVPSGVVLQPGGGPDLRVLRTSDGDAAVSPGFAVVEGYGVEVDDLVPLEVSLNTASGARIDRAVLRLDRSGRTVSPHVIEGTPATGSGTPQTPSLTRTDTVWDLPLARWTRGPLGGAIGTITDERQFSASAGAVAAASDNRHSALQVGGLSWETDSRRLTVFDGSTHQTLVDANYPSAWRPIPLRSGYERGSGGFPPSWRWLKPGLVQLSGTISRVNGSPLPHTEYYARMPEEARPAGYTRAAVACESRGAVAIMRLDISSTHPTTTHPGRIIGYLGHEARWVALDNFIYPTR
ncbi:hypothetical protein NE857_05575 [Nocardiopsis exhalans]|uniref:Uncharacterized protein n=1 Tax=Nocardiopsis exhalans TaxID=163604 RepID=A0ABY5DBH7_9ACTN|nr:hypothetical protein [Nocardiopsis exhalans]USY21111.1 hypothetical protein NE857_05575 [Nocardiopsis exhalans]